MVNDGRYLQIGNAAALIMRNANDRGVLGHIPVEPCVPRGQRAMDGGHHGNTRRPVGVEGSGKGVVVDNVHVLHARISLDDVVQLAERQPQLFWLARTEAAQLRNGAGAVSRRGQEYLMPCVG
jgi:hypothetical protein